MDKFTVARRQLLTAVEMHFNEQDPISIHTLAGAAQEILEKLSIKKGIKPFSKHILAAHPQKTEKEIHNIFNEYKNAFKHYGMKDDDEVLKEFKETHNDHMLYIAIWDYMNYKESMPVDFQVFQAWFYCLYPERLSQNVPAVWTKSFPGLKLASRSEQKRRARATIAWALQQSEIMDSPKTEPPSSLRCFP